MLPSSSLVPAFWLPFQALLFAARILYVLFDPGPVIPEVDFLIPTKTLPLLPTPCALGQIQQPLLPWLAFLLLFLVVAATVLLILRPSIPSIPHSLNKVGAMGLVAYFLHLCDVDRRFSEPQHMIALILRSGFSLVSKVGTLLLGTTGTNAFKSIVRVCGLAIVGHSVWIPIIRGFHRRPRLAWPDVGERLLKAFALAPLFLIPIWHPRLGPFIQKTLWVCAFVVHSVIPSSNVLHRIVRGLQLWEYENLMLLLGPALIHAVYMVMSTTYSSITAMFRPWMHAPRLAISNICLLFALQRALEAVSLVLMFMWGYFVSLVTWHCVRVGIHLFLAGIIFDPPYLIQLVASYDLWKAARETQINSARQLLHRAMIEAVLRGRAPWVHFLIVVVPPIAFYIRRGAVPFRRKVRRAWRSFMRLLF